jgi:hypothetical protein
MDVFLTSPWIPAEWIRAHGHSGTGFQPVQLEIEANMTGRMPVPLQAGVCAFAERLVRFAETQPDSAVIFSTACDQMRRGFDTAMLHGKPRVFLFNLPATWQTTTARRLPENPSQEHGAGKLREPAGEDACATRRSAGILPAGSGGILPPVKHFETAAKEIFRAELKRLGQFLLTVGGHAPSPERLRQEMLQSGAARKCLLESAPGSSPRGFAEAVARFHRDGTFSPPPPAAPANQIPLALVGGPFLAPHWKLLDEIEAAGGRVVLNATKTGERSLSPVFEFSADTNPFDALVHGYCDHIVDVFQRPNTRLYSWLKPRLASRQVRGIVLWHFTGCDLWRAEAQTLRETFGLPVLLIEAGGEPGNAPRELTRLQAFVEMLK